MLICMSTYSRTAVNNLDLHVETGTYYARCKVQGNTVRHAVGQDKDEAIKKKEVWIKKIKGENSRIPGSLGSLVEKYIEWLVEQVTLGEITESTKLYKLDGLKYLRNVWPDFDFMQLSKLTKKRMRKFRVAMLAKYSKTRANGAITVVREIINLSVENNMISKSDAAELLEDTKYSKVAYDGKRRLAHLPSHTDFLRLRDEVERRCKARGTLGFWLFCFLYLSGARIESANFLHWVDVDFVKSSIYYRKAKRGPYTTPLFPELRELLLKLREITGGQDLVLPTKSIQTVLTGACKALGLHHLSHHDLRHLFATRCIENHKDFSIIGSWMGHHDNGRTCQLIYGHLREAFGTAEAADLKLM